MTPEEREAMIEGLMRELGYTREQAERLAGTIGDVIVEEDEQAAAEEEGDAG